MPSPKDVRKQIKNILQDHPELLEKEMQGALYRQLSQEIEGKLQAIAGNVTESLKRIDQRSKDVQDMIMRQVLALQPAPAVTPASEVAPQSVTLEVTEQERQGE